MERETDQNRALRGYLLGNLSLQDQQMLEERLLADDGSFEQLLFMEEELIDDYLSGELSSQERARFEKHFLAAPERQQDLRFAKALRKYVASSTAKKKTTDSLSLVSTLRAFFASLTPRRAAIVFSPVIILVLLIAGFWLVGRMQRTSPQPQQAGVPKLPSTLEQPSPERQDQIANGNQDATNKQANSPVEIPVKNETPNPEVAVNPTPQKAIVFSIALTPGSVREGGGMKTVELPRNATMARFQLEFDSALAVYQRYRARLENRSGEAILIMNSLRVLTTPRGKIVNWQIPARLLKAEDYRLKLSGQKANGQSEPVAAYSFRVLD